MTVKEQSSSTKPGAILRPDVLTKIAKEAESAQLKEASALDRKMAEEREAVKQAFMSRDIRSDAVDRVNAAVQRAAEASKHEIELFRFPASFCSDGGRRINNNQPDWPESLEGFARRAYDAYVEHYKPLGYKMKAQVMDFPNGMMGEIALFLSW
jgi:hypothetical protein